MQNYNTVETTRLLNKYGTTWKWKRLLGNMFVQCRLASGGAVTNNRKHNLHIQKRIRHVLVDHIVDPQQWLWSVMTSEWSVKCDDDEVQKLIATSAAGMSRKSHTGGNTRTGRTQRVEPGGTQPNDRPTNTRAADRYVARRHKNMYHTTFRRHRPSILHTHTTSTGSGKHPIETLNLLGDGCTRSEILPL